MTWSASSKICCQVIVTQQRPTAEQFALRSRVSQPAYAGKEADLVKCKLITACYQNSEPDSCAVWMSYRQTTVIARINPTNWN